MKILALTDIHSDASRIPEIAEEIKAADVVVITGDITHFGTAEELDDILETFRKYNPNILAVPGNCDARDTKDLLHGRHHIIQDAAFFGVGGSLPCPGATPNEFSEEELLFTIKQAIDGIGPDPQKIMLTHQPPYGVKGDQLSTGEHVGCKAIGQFIEEVQPLICFCGHIHEGIGVSRIKSTHVVNPGPFGFNQGHYALAKISDKVEELILK